MLDKAIRAQAEARDRASAHTHASARPRARTHARKHTEICDTYCFSTATKVSSKRLSVKSCVHTLPVLHYYTTVPQQHVGDGQI